jgi:ABC-type hemin transport system ATPase subunit
VILEISRTDKPGSLSTHLLTASTLSWSKGLPTLSSSSRSVLPALKRLAQKAIVLRDGVSVPYTFSIEELISFAEFPERAKKRITALNSIFEGEVFCPSLHSFYVFVVENDIRWLKIKM